MRFVVWTARRFAAVPLEDIVLGIVVSITLPFVILVTNAPNVLLLLPLAYSGMLAGSAAGLWVLAFDYEPDERRKFAWFSVVALVPVGLMAVVAAARTGGTITVVLISVVAVASGAVLRIVDERSVDLGGAGPTST